MDDTTLETLEYPAVLKELASFTLTPVGGELVLLLRPVPDAASILDAYAEFSELSGIVKIAGTLPLGGVSDIRPLLEKLGPGGAYLLSEELLLVRAVLGAIVELKKVPTAAFSKLYPRTSARIEALSDQAELHSELQRILDDKGEIKDSASPALYRIRKEIRSNKGRAREILEEITTDKKTREYLQEDIISIRDDRYVLAIKAGVHAAFNGVIHGRSGSGATFFIEPFQLVELNNRVAVLKKEEKAEEIEILKAASREVLRERELLYSDLASVAVLDSVQAKALFAR